MTVPTRLGLLWLCALALFACSGTRCGREGPETTRTVESAPPPDLRLLVITDPKGYLEPCGCQQRPLGGVDKLATLLKQARSEGVPSLLLAAGDLAFGTELSETDSASAHTQEAWRAQTLLDVWQALGLDAAAPGPLDLAQPAEQLRELAERGGFPWLAENKPDEGADLLSQGRILRAGEIAVGVFGLLAPTPRLAQSTPLAFDASLGDVAQRTSKALREQGAQLVVALVTGDRRDLRAVAAAGPDIVVAGGLDLEQPLLPAVHGGAAIVHAGRQGQRLLSVDLKLSGDGPLRDVSEWSRQEARESLKAQIEELREKISEWEAAENVASADLSRQRDKLAQMEADWARPQSVSYAGRWLRAKVHELGPEVKGDAQIAQKLDAHDKRVNQHNKQSLSEVAPKPVAQGQASYVGAATCGTCHGKALAWWRTTKHGRAYATLEDVDKEFNLNCVGCHVTGYNQPGGSTVTHVQDLKDVGCESCHGPGSSHVATPSAAKLVRDTPQTTCEQCHTPEHSDRFKYEAFKTLLVAPGHGLPAE